MEQRKGHWAGPQSRGALETPPGAWSSKESPLHRLSHSAPTGVVRGSGPGAPKGCPEYQLQTAPPAPSRVSRGPPKILTYLTLNVSKAPDSQPRGHTGCAASEDNLETAQTGCVSVAAGAVAIIYHFIVKKETKNKHVSSLSGM